jgi:exodeoxyribonuclease-1
MAASFLFYDLETSGISPRTSRIMQFAGQRTDMDLKPVGEPYNILIRLSPDILPDPNAIMLTGITPQQTINDGITEAEFLKFFHEEIVQPATIFVGFNSIRFDDEFMRFTNYRNFYDAYAWQWQDSCSKWDILDLVRMTRALRPEGIEWPFGSDGKPANRLEYLTSVNKIDHVGAHDALSDVNATIAVAKLVKTKQPELFKYLLGIRGKREVQELVDKHEAFVYTSSHFSSEYLHTTVSIMLAPSPTPGAALVYDLRYDPSPFLEMTVDQLIEAWAYSKDPDHIRLPVKTIKYNHAPAVAPLGVIKDKATQERIGIDLKTVAANLKILKNNQAEFATKVLSAITKLDESRKKPQASLIENQLTVDEQLYDGNFFSKSDAELMYKVVSSSPDKLSDIGKDFSDDRLKLLLPLYKARNYPKSLNSEETKHWEDYCQSKLITDGKTSRLAGYFSKLDELARGDVNKKQQYLLEELMLYGQSVAPMGESDN